METMLRLRYDTNIDVKRKSFRPQQTCTVMPPTTFVFLSAVMKTTAVASIPAADGGVSSIGGAHNKAVHSPPPTEGKEPPSSTIFIAASIYLRGDTPPFANLEEYSVWKESAPTDSEGMPYSLHIDHFVPICPGPTTQRLRVSIPGPTSLLLPYPTSLLFEFSIFGTLLYSTAILCSQRLYPPHLSRNFALCRMPPTRKTRVKKSRVTEDPPRLK